MASFRDRLGALDGWQRLFLVIVVLSVPFLVSRLSDDLDRFHNAREFGAQFDSPVCAEILKMPRKEFYEKFGSTYDFYYRKKQSADLRDQCDQILRVRHLEAGEEGSSRGMYVRGPLEDSMNAWSNLRLSVMRSLFTWAFILAGIFGVGFVARWVVKGNSSKASTKSS